MKQERCERRTEMQHYIIARITYSVQSSLKDHVISSNRYPTLLSLRVVKRYLSVLYIIFLAIYLEYGKPIIVIKVSVWWKSR